MFRNAPRTAWALAVVVATSLLALWQAPSVQAQNSALNELYGEGVHAYFAGEYRGAHALLSKAIDNGSEDPRAYYFRGLAYLKLGREPEARDDFAAGADLEVADTDRFYNVSKSLERVQGARRLMLERFRSEARLLAFEELERRRFERYERIRRAEPDVLLRTPPAGEAPPPEGDAVEPDDAGPVEDSPEGDTPPDEVIEEQMDEEPPAELDPFEEGAADPEAAEEPAELDPFGAGVPAEEPAGEGPGQEEEPQDAEADDAAAEDAEAEDADAETPDAEAEAELDDAASAAPANKVPGSVLARSIGGALSRAIQRMRATAADADTASGDDSGSFPSEDAFGAGEPDAGEPGADDGDADLGDPFGGEPAEEAPGGAAEADAADEPFGN